MKNHPRKIAVVFDNTKTVIVTDPSIFDRLEGKPNVVWNPDLSGVNGYPPHHWKLVDGAVVPMNYEECRKRDDDASLNLQYCASSYDPTTPEVKTSEVVDKIREEMNNSLMGQKKELTDIGASHAKLMESVFRVEKEFSRRLDASMNSAYDRICSAEKKMVVVYVCVFVSFCFNVWLCIKR